jgi:hypothetical protein
LSSLGLWEESKLKKAGRKGGSMPLNPKSEVRSPKSEGNPKPESRNYLLNAAICAIAQLGPGGSMPFILAAEGVEPIMRGCSISN